jgi:hypothetical protein
MRFEHRCSGRVNNQHCFCKEEIFIMKSLFSAVIALAFVCNFAMANEPAATTTETTTTTAAPATETVEKKEVVAKKGHHKAAKHSKKSTKKETAAPAEE